MNGADDGEVLVFWGCSFGKTATTNAWWPVSVGQSYSVDHQVSLQPSGRYMTSWGHTGTVGYLSFEIEFEDLRTGENYLHLFYFLKL